MKTKVFNDLKTKDIDTLVNNLKVLEKEIINDYMELKMSKVKNVHTTTNKRKDIAKIKSIIKMKVVTSDKIDNKTIKTDQNYTKEEKEKLNGSS